MTRSELTAKGRMERSGGAMRMELFICGLRSNRQPMAGYLKMRYAVCRILLTATVSQFMFNLMVERPRDHLGDVFGAIADPTRRAIVQMLVRKPATISEIARPFPVSFNAVSKHVMVLERAGLVHREITGREHVCRLRPRALRRANAWLEQYRQFWESRLDALDTYVAMKTKERRQAHGKTR